MNTKHPSRVLRRQRSGGRHRVAPMGRDDLLVSFQPAVNDDQ
jgi:hypothetical protein